MQDGKNLSVSSDGVFDIYYNAELEQICVVAKDGTPTWNEATPPEDSFVSPDWASVPAKTEGNHTFKFTKDDTYAYFYTERIRDARFDELWGTGAGYVYFAFDIDGDPDNGETLNSQGPYDYVAYFFCFSGDKDNPVIGINKEGGVAPSSFSLDNIIAQGSVDEDGLTLEYRIPLADLPALPESFTITTWGNKSLSKVVYKVPYEEDGKVVTIDGDMSDWADVVGVETPDNICKAMKINNDEDNFYFYLASEPGPRGSQLWGPSAAYYYLDFDLDNDPSTGGETEGSRGTVEAYTYLYLFGGSADAPEIAENPSGTGSHGVAIDGIVAKGVITDELIEIELSIPRANFKENPAAGQEIRVISWRSKDGTVIEQIYTVK